MRAPDAGVPPEEALYRSILGAWLNPDGSVSFEAVHSNGTSVDRSSYRSPEGCLAHHQALGRPWTGVAEVKGADLPPADPGEQGGNSWEYFVVDDPNAENEAHAAIRTRRVQDSPSTAHVRVTNKAVSHRMKVALAARMRVVLRPAP